MFGQRLAAGYLDPKDKEQAFSTTQLDEREQRFYHTGDLARVDEQNRLHFTGRSDRRLKIRGFRVDLAEVESALDQLEGIEKSHVLPHYINDSKIPSGLLAAFTIEREFEGEPAQVRQQLQQRLPDYMVPGRLVSLAEMPRTPSGKLDRQALVSNILETSHNGSEVQLPSNQTEETLYEIWKRVLGQKSFSVTEDFFDLGGDSLSALSLITEIEKTFDRPLPLDAIFERTTIEGLAQSLAEESQPAAGTAEPDPSTQSRFASEYSKQFRKLVSLVSGRKGKRLHPASLIVEITPDNGSGKAPLFFCANGQSEAEDLAVELGPDQPLYFLESGFYVISRTSGVIQALAEHHLPDILNLYPSGPYAILGYSFGCSTAMVLAQLVRSQNQAISFVGLLDARIGPSPSYRWYFKHIDQAIVRHLEVERSRIAAVRKDQGVFTALKQTGAALGSFVAKRTTGSNGSSGSGARPHADIIPSDEPAYQPPSYEGPIYLFRASSHWFRNFLFPRAGFPKTPYPRLSITKIPGSHHTAISDPSYKAEAGKAIQAALNGRG